MFLCEGKAWLIVVPQQYSSLRSGAAAFGLLLQDAIETGGNSSSYNGSQGVLLESLLAEQERGENYKQREKVGHRFLCRTTLTTIQFTGVVMPGVPQNFLLSQINYSISIFMWKNVHVNFCSALDGCLVFGLFPERDGDLRRIISINIIPLCIRGSICRKGEKRCHEMIW